MAMRGIRGATTVEDDAPEQIWSATRELGREMLARNALNTEDIGAIIFSATADLKSAFPATGMRQIPGMEFVPLFDAQQLYVEKSLPRTIRILMLAETSLSQKEISHVYLRRAAALRPDLI